jgi:hypothetical protein
MNYQAKKQHSVESSPKEILKDDETICNSQEKTKASIQTSFVSAKGKRVK